MNKYLFLLVSLIISISANSQTSVVSGKVVDENNLAISFANVFLMKDTTIISAVFSDQDGKFQFEVIAGKYSMKASYIGYKKWVKEIIVLNENISINIQLELSKNMMDQVLITDFRNEMKAGIDKKIISLSEDMRRSNNNAAELLELVPIVNMDFDGNPSIPGKRSVIILVDGRPPKIRANDLATVLKAISSDKILSIEIMTNPPAKYTTGNAAVINLVTNKAPQKGSLFSTWARINNLKALNLGGSFTYQYNKFSITTYAGRWQYNGKYHSEKVLKNFLSDNIYLKNSIEETNFGGSGLWYGISPEYKINDKNTVSVYIGSNGHNYGNDENSEFVLTKRNNEIYNEYSINSKSVDESSSYYGGVEYFKLFKEKEKEFNIEIGIDYDNSSNKYNNEQLFNQEPDNKYQLTTTEDNAIEIFLNTEYFDPIDSTSSYNLSFSLEKEFPHNHIYIHSTGMSEKDLLKIDQLSYKSSLSNFEEKITFTYAKKINKSSFSFDIGQTYFKYDNLYDEVIPLKKSYNFITPKASLTQSFGKSNEIGISYKYSSNVPRTWRLNPNKRISVDGLNVRYGNPNLDLEKSHEVELNFGFFLGKFNIGTVAFWRRTNNAISNFRIVDNNGITYNTYKNNSAQVKSGMQISISGSIKNKIKLNLSGSLFDNRFVSQGKTHKLIGYNLNSSINAYIPYDFKVRLNARLTGPTLLIQGERDARFYLGMSIKKSLFKKKLSLTLYFRDMLRTSTRITTLDTPDFYSRIEAKYINAFVGIRANFRIGKLKDMPKSSKARQNSQGRS